jgi:hypothetical protein
MISGPCQIQCTRAQHDPGSAGCGTLSPVTSETSSSDKPLVTCESTGTRSPAASMMVIPGSDFADRQIGLRTVTLQHQRAPRRQTREPLHRDTRALTHHVIEGATDQ